MSHVLLVSGLDPSGGAGIIADVRVAEQCGLRPVGVVTALTVQDSRGVSAVRAVPAEVIGQQLSALLSDVEVAAVKIGMLGNPEIARVIGEALALTAAPVVWDPVGLPTAGSVALYAGDLGDAADLLRAHLTVITPNLAEAAALTGASIATVEEQSRAALAVSERCGCAAVVTGGHLPASESLADVIASEGVCTSIGALRVETPGPVHGTGCAFSTALACQLGLGRDLEPAVVFAGRFVRAKLAQPRPVGRGHSAVM